jgi:hypothetical protein
MTQLSLNPNSWSCLPTSVANVIGMPVAEFIALIGHDGNEYPYGPPHEHQQRGFHTQECINVLIDLGYSATPVEVYPSLKPAEESTGIAVFKDSAMLFYGIVESSIGFICGEWEGVGHCVANFKGEIVDPRYSWSNKIYGAYYIHDQNFKPLVYFKVNKCT